MTKTTRQMSDKHEAHLVEVLGGRATKGSGNQFNNQADGRHNRLHEEFAWAWDGKSTHARSMSVRLSDWEKIAEQAHGERPMLPLRFYLDPTLRRTVDLVVVSLDDFAEVQERAREASHLRATMERVEKYAQMHTDRYDYGREVVNLAEDVLALLRGEDDRLGLV